MIFNVKVYTGFFIPLKCYLLMTVEKITGETTSLDLLLAIKETGIGKSDRVLCQFSGEPPRPWNGGRRSQGTDPSREKEEGGLPNSTAHRADPPFSARQSKLHSL